MTVTLEHSFVNILDRLIQLLNSDACIWVACTQHCFVVHSSICHRKTLLRPNDCGNPAATTKSDFTNRVVGRSG